MEAFRDLDHFKSFIEVSPVLRTERSRVDFEEPGAEPISAAAATPIDAIPAKNMASATGAATGTGVPPAFKAGRNASANLAKPIRPHPDVRLARDLVMAGGLGTVLCVAWWFRFYVLDGLHVELLRRGLSESVILSTNLSTRHYLSCFFLNGEPCVAMKSWGRFAGHVIYEPAFAWASICALGLGFLLIQVHRRKDKDRKIEE